MRGQRASVDILGTSITCSGTRTSKATSNTNGRSTICGTGTSRAGNPGTASTIWSTVRRRSLSCGLTSESRSGRAPPGSSYRLKSSGWGMGGIPDRGRGVHLAPPHTPALAVFCPREEWCVLSARAIATVIRSCLSHERSRRCRRRCAAPETGCSLRSIPQQVTQTRALLG